MQKEKFEEGKLNVHTPGSRIYKATLRSPLEYGGLYTVIHAIIYFVYIHFQTSLLPVFFSQVLRKYMLVSVSNVNLKYRLTLTGKRFGTAAL
jgi:hypothetical protein